MLYKALRDNGYYDKYVGKLILVKRLARRLLDNSFFSVGTVFSWNDAELARKKADKAWAGIGIGAKIALNMGTKVCASVLCL